MKTRIFIAVALLLSAGQLMAANIRGTRTYLEKWTLAPGGSFSINNPFGNIEIVGGDGPDVEAAVTKTIIAVDQAALDEGTDQTQLRAGGDDRVRVVQTQLPRGRNPRWSSTVDYKLRIPRSVHVSVSASTSALISISGIRGNVVVKTYSGLVVLDGVSGAARVENTNGSIRYISDNPVASADLTTVNGNIQLVVGPSANFRWVADSLTGDFRSALPVRGELLGATFRGNVNAPGGPTITTATMMGHIVLVPRGVQPQQAVMLNERPEVRGQTSGSRPRMVPAAVQQQVHQGRFAYKTNLGDVRVSEIRGDAFVETGAGEVTLGAVFGICNVTSGGGPLHLGEIHGTMIARTRAGDVLVDAAREGGTLHTDGGIIRVLYSGGPLSLRSGGGDITVRQTTGAISAETRSGDINLTMDPLPKSERIEATTAKGNVVLNIPPRFGADVEATIVTTTPDAHAIKSDIPGLATSREQLPGGKTRIRATGKINGGGEKVQLTAENGGIQITAKPLPPVTVKR